MDCDKSSSMMRTRFDGVLRRQTSAAVAAARGVSAVAIDAVKAEFYFLETLPLVAITAAAVEAELLTAIATAALWSLRAKSTIRQPVSVSKTTRCRENSGAIRVRRQRRPKRSLASLRRRHHRRGLRSLRRRVEKIVSRHRHVHPERLSLLFSRPSHRLDRGVHHPSSFLALRVDRPERPRRRGDHG